MEVLFSFSLVSSYTFHYKFGFPVYENSFYFYFGLKDGNTAIDRLYGEYFSECTDNSVTETGDIEQGNTSYEASGVENPNDAEYQKK